MYKIQSSSKRHLMNLLRGVKLKETLATQLVTQKTQTKNKKRPS